MGGLNNRLARLAPRTTRLRAAIEKKPPLGLGQRRLLRDHSCSANARRHGPHPGDGQNGHRGLSCGYRWHQRRTGRREPAGLTTSSIRADCSTPVQACCQIRHDNSRFFGIISFCQRASLMSFLSKDLPLDDDWQNAQAALAEAQAMPGGPARIVALKKAGKLRFAAAEKMLSALAVSQVKDSIEKRNPPG
jgi:hypothetical protein